MMCITYNDLELFTNICNQSGFIDHLDKRQTMSLPNIIVVVVMCWRNLHGSCRKQEKQYYQEFKMISR